jgi:two-component system chemotaxis sensor kinase CheA
VQTKSGHGSTVRMKIPLTLAIIPALVVTSRGDRYAIPQVSLLELVRLEGEQVRKGIELVNGAPVHRLRGHLLPLVYLNKELGLEHDGASESPNGQATNIVILQADDRTFGLVVDEINDTEEIVVKPLSKQLKNINTYAGATIMGDGRVALILDVVGLAHCANVVGEVRDRAGAEVKEGSEGVTAANPQSGRKTVLLFRNGELERMAIDLALVSRLEEIPRNMLEYSGTQEMIQYRGNIIPLIRVADILGGPSAKTIDAAAESLQVVVYSDEGCTVGLVIDQILDIVEEAFVIQPQTGRMGVLGAAVIQQRTTEMLDVRAIVAASQCNEIGMTAHA